MDVDENDSPLHIVYKNKKKRIFKHANYRDQRNYNDIEDKNLIYKNIGKEGDLFFLVLRNVCIRQVFQKTQRYNGDCLYCKYRCQSKK